MLTKDQTKLLLARIATAEQALRYSTSIDSPPRVVRTARKVVRQWERKQGRVGDRFRKRIARVVSELRTAVHFAEPKDAQRVLARIRKFEREGK